MRRWSALWFVGMLWAVGIAGYLFLESDKFPMPAVFAVVTAVHGFVVLAGWLAWRNSEDLEWDIKLFLGLMLTSFLIPFIIAFAPSPLVDTVYDDVAISIFIVALITGVWLAANALIFADR